MTTEQPKDRLVFPGVQSFARDGKAPLAVAWVSDAKSLNEWDKIRPEHRGKEKRRISKWLFATRRSGAVVPPPTSKRYVVITRGTFPGRLLDEDNLVGGCKRILDALKPGRGLGLIKDDSKEWVKAYYYQNETEPPGWARVEVWEKKP